MQREQFSCAGACQDYDNIDKEIEVNTQNTMPQSTEYIISEFCLKKLPN